jgi:phage tail-like protein
MSANPDNGSAGGADPFHLFRFHIDFKEDPFKGGNGKEMPLCSGVFSECTGLEATMEPKVIKEGGGNYGANQRVGPVTFATVILKRGLTQSRDLWKWFEMVTRRKGYAYRLAAFINIYDAKGEVVIAWKLEKCLPIKFKMGDLNAKSTEVGVEELHLAHEGLVLLDVKKEATRPKLYE